ncbi:MAG TPA: hypothetical protein VMJ10_09115 [Kofleriaceae bacterium]|nr:hypothetical protein [Kofleriaceae bacterium]
MIRLRLLVPALVLAAGIARAQPAPPLAQIHDDKQLADAVAAIAPEPRVQALLVEGVHQLQAQAYDQALANFLEAYSKLPSPQILLNIAAVLRDMGRLADAANTYQRYLDDPANTASRADVEDLLAKLDHQLALLAIHVTPRGAEVSIDGGPYVTVGNELVARVRPGIHLVRVRMASATTELTVNGFEGETKDVAAAVAGSPNPSASLPDRVDSWLVTGTQYGADDASSRARRVRTGYNGPELAPIVPRIESDGGAVAVRYAGDHPITSGVMALARIDGAGRGFAGGLGIAYALYDRVELDGAGLYSQFWGAYLGASYRFRTGKLRPYAGGGLPIFFFTDDQMRSTVAVGARVAVGLEVVVTPHISVAADAGYEHFFDISDVTVGHEKLDADLFVPTVGLIGRM